MKWAAQRLKSFFPGVTGWISGTARSALGAAVSAATATSRAAYEAVGGDATVALLKKALYYVAVMMFIVVVKAALVLV